MTRIFYILPFILFAVFAQENAVRNLAATLRECYENKYLVQRVNQLPHTLNTFLAIIRKIENTDGLNMDLRSLSVAILHRFRQDGIVPNPLVPVQAGVSPYAPNSFQFYRHAETLRFIPGNAALFPNNSLTDVERCTLHAMLSSSVEFFQRKDEVTVCRFTNSYRYGRSVWVGDETSNEGVIGDVETLSSDEIRTISERKSGVTPVTVDPNSLYPELPPNHPDNSRLVSFPPASKCPIENGVLKTPWGTISGGPLLAGIAAATQPETVTLQDLQLDLLQDNNASLSGLTLENKWIATLAGDLAEVALLQAPMTEKVSVGADGNWNSLALPRWYFLNANEKVEMTTAEIRGDLDGLILANEVGKWYSKIPGLRLSQIFDMYYSRRGLFDSSIRACNRRTLFTSVATNETMVAQVYSAAILLDHYISKVTIEPSAIEKFSINAINALVTYVPSAMNNDLSCSDTDRLYQLHQTSVDLTIILDTKWGFSEIMPILATLLENIELNQFNSNFTLINGYDGTRMINSTFNILDFHAYNLTQYENITRGFNLRKSLEELKWYLMSKLDIERKRGTGGAKSDIVLIVPYSYSVTTLDEEASLKTILEMRERIPDTTLLVMTHGLKDTWSSLVKDASTDLFSISVGDTEEALRPITAVISRIKQVPKRLINTQCGSDYTSIGSSNSYDDYIEPNGVNYYRLHSNYFFRPGNSTTIKIQGSDSDSLIVCWSREMYVNNTSSTKSCASITNNEHKITVSCDSYTYIHQCPPLYVSVSSNATVTSYQCADGRVCRFPYLRKYTISYEHLVCASNASKIAFNSLILIVFLIFYNH